MKNYSFFRTLNYNKTGEKQQHIPALPQLRWHRRNYHLAFVQKIKGSHQISEAKRRGTIGPGNQYDCKCDPVNHGKHKRFESIQSRRRFG